MKNRTTQHLLRILIFIGFVLILARLVDFSLVKEALQQVRLPILGVAVGLYFLNIGIRAYRLQVILNKDGPRINLKDSYLITLIGIALNMLIPSTLGDVAKSYYGYKIYGIKEEMISTSIVDKMFALCSLFLLGTISGYAMNQYKLGIVSLVSAIITFIPLACPQYIPWNLLNRLLGRFKKSLDSEKLLKAFHLPNILKMRVMWISIVGWLGTCLYFYCICCAFSATVSFGYVIIIMPIITIVRLFPFTVNALGPMEIAVVYFFNAIGIHATLAVLISLSSNIISSTIPGMLGFIIILTRGHKEKTLTKTS